MPSPIENNPYDPDDFRSPNINMAEVYKARGLNPGSHTQRQIPSGLLMQSETEESIRKPEAP